MDEAPPGEPGGGGEGGPRPFAIGYKAHNGDLMVYGGGALTLIGVLATVVNVNPAFLLASLVGSGSAFYFHPTLDLKTPQLGASREALYIARVGIIPWSEIAEISVQHRALRTVSLATLMVRTARPWREAVSQRDRIGLLGRITARNTRVVSADTVHVPLHTLAMNPEVVESRLRTLYEASRG